MNDCISGTLQILRLKQVLERTGKSRSATYEAIAKGMHPSSIRLGARSVGWLASEIDDYLRSCVAQSRTLTKEGV